MGWTLRLRCSSGMVKQLHDVDKESTVFELKSRIADALRLPNANSLRLYLGFPPKEITAPDNTSLTCVDKLGDCVTLIVSISSSEKKPSRFLSTKSIVEHTLSKPVDENPTTKSTENELDTFKTLISQQLVESVDPTTAANSLKGLYKCFKDATLQAYEQRRAMDREHAARSANYQIFDVPGQYTLSGISLNFRVSFPVGRHKKVHEDCPKLPESLLKIVFRQLIEHPDHRENLRPFNMARTSPHVFWNVVRIKGAHTTNSLEEFIKSLVPQGDWSFYEHRIRNLSTKSLENRQWEAEKEERLQRRKKKSLTHSSTGEGNAAKKEKYDEFQSHKKEDVTD
eukprot:gene1903-4997_t